MQILRIYKENCVFKRINNAIFTQIIQILRIYKENCVLQVIIVSQYITLLYRQPGEIDENTSNKTPKVC